MRISTPAGRSEGELEKVVLTQRNQMRAVLITLALYNELEQHAASATGPQRRHAVLLDVTELRAQLSASGLIPSGR